MWWVWSALAGEAGAVEVALVLVAACVVAGLGATALEGGVHIALRLQDCRERGPLHLRYLGMELAEAYRDGGFRTLEEFFALSAAPDYTE